MNFKDRATLLTVRGIPVVPVQPRLKKCLLPKWQELASIDPTQIEKWLQVNPDFNTGAVQKFSNTLAFDIDDTAIADEILHDCGLDLRLLKTFKVTGSKPAPAGHYYFAQTGASRMLGNRQLKIKNRTTGKENVRFDLKSEAAYVVGPGSIHPSGAVYTIVDDSPLVPFPDSLCAWIEKNSGTRFEGEAASTVSTTVMSGPRTLSTSEVATRILTRDLSVNDEESNRALSQNMGFAHRHEADAKFAIFLVRHSGLDPVVQREQFAKYKLHESRTSSYDDITFQKAYAFKLGQKTAPVDPERWREFCKTFGQLTTEEPRYIVDQIIPEGAMSAITGHSFHSKTWVALMIALAISKGEPLWDYFNVSTPRPVIYHCPEMSEAMIRHYLHVLGAEDDENLLVRPMEAGVWPLDDPLFLRSSIGRVTFLDTGGFFNPAEDGNDYKQALQFARLVFEAITAGSLGVIPLFHLAKGVKKEDWSLENSIIGSAGYGAMLRSCLRVLNLNADLNEPKVHLYLQGMKNPGLKPFQLVGPAPLRMNVKPGDSPYLKVLLSGDRDYIKACELFEKNTPQRQVAGQLNLSLGKVNKLHKRWEGKSTSEIEGEDDGAPDF